MTERVKIVFDYDLIYSPGHSTHDSVMYFPMNEIAKRLLSNPDKTLREVAKELVEEWLYVTVARVSIIEEADE